MSARVVHIVACASDGTEAQASLCGRDTYSIARPLFLPRYDAARIYDPAVRGIYSEVTFCERCIAQAAIWHEAYASLYGPHYFMYTPEENAARLR